MMPDDEIKKLSKDMELVYIESDTLLCSQGEGGDSMFVMIKGCARASCQQAIAFQDPITKEHLNKNIQLETQVPLPHVASAAQLLSQIYKEGDAFEEACVALGHRRIATVSALVCCAAAAAPDVWSVRLLCRSAQERVLLTGSAQQPAGDVSVEWLGSTRACRSAPCRSSTRAARRPPTWPKLSCSRLPPRERVTLACAASDAGPRLFPMLDHKELRMLAVGSQTQAYPENSILIEQGKAK
eukprot:748897-Hanusia_phi.AAC.3